MPDSDSLFWMVRCDRCAQPTSAHAMSILREETLCMPCLVREAAAIAAGRQAGRIPAFARDSGSGAAGAPSRPGLLGRRLSRAPAEGRMLQVREVQP